ncbi:hypothetical protein RN001_009622 [Aquatica leii]|uniref:Glutathione transferase n=1 Tax=Aquatica leii TaxID=1421715 RepID=A0AAN7P903_9COLE|nr:hypothetical protein RN001_009622 [Aquatica leii]
MPDTNVNVSDRVTLQLPPFWSEQPKKAKQLLKFEELSDRQQASFCDIFEAWKRKAFGFTISPTSESIRCAGTYILYSIPNESEIKFVRDSVHFNKMAPKLYYNEVSPPVRSVLLTAKAIGLELDLEQINLFAGEHLKPEYLKINPQHTVPTLDDDGYYLWDSHAINKYICEKYGQNDSLYPKDLHKRGTVDQRLFFNAGIIQPRVGAIVGPIIRQGATSIPKENADNLAAAYDFLETFLEGHEYIAGDSLTIADMSIIASLSGIVHFVPVAQNKHPKLSKWMNKMQQLPYYVEANQVGTDKLVGFLQSKLA